jgi:hypothetical protein
LEITWLYICTSFVPPCSLFALLDIDAVRNLTFGRDGPHGVGLRGR